MSDNQNDDDIRYLMLGEEGFLERPPYETWYEESEVVDLDRLQDIVSDRDKTSKALDFICDKSRSRQRRLEKLLSLDKTHAFGDSNIPGEVLLGIWESDMVSDYWKRKTLARVMKSQFYGVNVVPLEFQWNVARALVNKDYSAEDVVESPTRGNVLKMLHDGEFEKLDRLANSRRLGRAGDASIVFLGQFLFHVLMLADYDIASSDGNRYLMPAVKWIEKTVPGVVADATDRFGNNALVYLYATLTESNPSYLMRTRDGIEMAEEDAEFLKSLGCDAGQKNVFGVSAAMLSAAEG